MRMVTLHVYMQHMIQNPEEETALMEEKFVEQSTGYQLKLRKRQKFVYMKTL